MTKRLFDLMFSIIGLMLLAPVFLLLAIWIKSDSLGPVFFRQERVGLNRSNFKIFKFRTMHLDSEKRGGLTIGDDSRITHVGSFLRKYKIDELPQLFDVAIGRMSLVGPRPELPEFINMYSNDMRKKVLSVKPGITDMASIRMSNESDILKEYEDVYQAYIDVILPIKQKYYCEYVDNNSLWLDVKIIFLTFKKILLH